MGQTDEFAASSLIARQAASSTDYSNLVAIQFLHFASTCLQEKRHAKIPYNIG